MLVNVSSFRYPLAQHLKSKFVSPSQDRIHSRKKYVGTN